MTDGDANGQSITIPSVNGPGAPRFNVGDEVVLSYSGSQPQAAESYQIVDFQRDWSLVILAVLFAAAVLLLGRWQGLAALGDGLVRHPSAAPDQAVGLVVAAPHEPVIGRAGDSGSAPT